VENTYDVKFSKSGMIYWLHDHNFSYKKPNRVPAKADKSRQELFIEMYDTLKSELGKDDVMLFGDGVHPSMETKVASGWIRIGKHKELKTTASRARLNILGALELDSMNLLTKDYKTIDSDSVIDFMEQLKDFIVDNGPYYTSNIVKQKAVELGITMVYLPPYNANLNPIERL
jgi:hypothetical protein